MPPPEHSELHRKVPELSLTSHPLGLTRLPLGLTRLPLGLTHHPLGRKTLKIM